MLGTNKGGRKAPIALPMMFEDTKTAKATDLYVRVWVLTRGGTTWLPLWRWR